MAKRSPANASGKLRCAVYTRKSTEEGLDQAFNSLDAQREACAAYVLSQQHEGWSLVPNLYDDGGFSGGNMERPALTRLLADVAAGKVDVIVVYKVDRLTRSLADFARIVEVLDARGASFVSVTQAFNTTNSMGRLTLNVLLSFAQFEREVTGERIRDKVAASKRKGMWMGGTVPLGYDLKDRKLFINEQEATTVRLIFERYLVLGSIGALAVELEQQGVRSKARVLIDGARAGERTFSKGALAHLLRNPLYIGQVRHKGATYPGEHSAIIERELFARVQQMLDAGSPARRVRVTDISPLTGTLKDVAGRRMTPSHATKGSRRYRYYVTAADAAGQVPEDGWRVPAGELEQLVRSALVEHLSDERWLISQIGEGISQYGLQQQLARCRCMVEELSTETSSAFRKHLLGMSTAVHLRERHVVLTIDLPTSQATEPLHCTIEVPATVTRRGHELRLAFPSPAPGPSRKADAKLLGLIAKAEAAFAELTSGAEIEKVRRAHLARLARLKFLAPDIVSAIIDGRHPVELTARLLLRMSVLPMRWCEQRTALGLA